MFESSVVTGSLGLLLFAKCSVLYVHCTKSKNQDKCMSSCDLHWFALKPIAYTELTEKKQMSIKMGLKLVI